MCRAGHENALAMEEGQNGDNGMESIWRKLAAGQLTEK